MTVEWRISRRPGTLDISKMAAAMGYVTALCLPISFGFQIITLRESMLK